jgi:pimeloyl-ACP methyl ester carboxylesterase
LPSAAAARSPTTDIGKPGWPSVLFFHGAPMSRLHLAYLEDRFVAARIRVVTPDRPAYGRPAPQPDRSLADWPADVAALADALGIDRFIVADHSSGGPYAVKHIRRRSPNRCRELIGAEERAPGAQRGASMTSDDQQAADRVSQEDDSPPPTGVRSRSPACFLGHHQTARPAADT